LADTTVSSLTNSGATTLTGALTAQSTASVSGALTLYGTPTIATTAKQSLTLGDSNTGNIIMSGGDVGVGTTTPLAKLHVEGNCVALGTLIRRRRKKKNGEWEDEDVPVEDIDMDDEVLTLDEKSGEFIWSRVEKTMNMGYQTVFELTTSDGKKIETTDKHPYLTRSGKWIKIKDLKVGQEIAVAGQDDLPFVFVDETGVSRNDGVQNEQGLGAFILSGDKEQIFTFNQQLRQVLISALDILRKREGEVEFKFSSITKTSLPLYQKLIEILKTNRHLWQFSWIFEQQKGTAWDQYLSQTDILLTRFGTNVVFLMDYLDKPKVSNKIPAIQNFLQVERALFSCR